MADIANISKFFENLGETNDKKWGIKTKLLNENLSLYSLLFIANNEQVEVNENTVHTFLASIC